MIVSLIASFPRVEGSFVHKIHNTRYKTKNSVASVSKCKIRFTRSDAVRTHQFIQNAKQTIDDDLGHLGQLQKSFTRLKKQSEGVFIKAFNTNPTR